MLVCSATLIVAIPSIPSTWDADMMLISSKKGTGSFFYGHYWSSAVDGERREFFEQGYPYVTVDNCVNGTVCEYYEFMPGSCQCAKGACTHLLSFLSEAKVGSNAPCGQLPNEGLNPASKNESCTIWSDGTTKLACISADNAVCWVSVEYALTLSYYSFTNWSTEVLSNFLMLPGMCK